MLSYNIVFTHRILAVLSPREAIGWEADSADTSAPTNRIAAGC
ncbi:hypothetical protein QOZ95_004999 [Paenibacillus brasilensis]|uniref:Uncharacterized protein n=1 Tax=Paenibacillus brasilensis TaxID=128574 RepID=A0ABU0L676_9BACL|nr:hypothetical protein [Paenibacillus brasilensis]